MGLERVLLVEDSVTERRLMTSLILRATESRYEVDAVETASAAIGLLEARQYWAVVADVHLKDGSGLDVVACALRLQPTARRVVVTADREIETLQDALRRGRIHNYLSKGWGSERLLDQLTVALGS